MHLRALRERAWRVAARRDVVTASITFRIANDADALCIATLGFKVYLDTYAPDGIRPSIARDVLSQWSTEAVLQDLSTRGSRFVLAERAGFLIGFAHVQRDVTHEGIAADHPAKLHRLYVQETFTGHGLGRSLLRAAEDSMRDDGADVLWLTAWIGNSRALAFYPRCGYRDVGQDWYTFENESFENRVFSRAIAAA